MNGQRIRPGMTVKAGTVLAALKTDDKKDELRKYLNDAYSNRKQADYHDAQIKAGMKRHQLTQLEHFIRENDL